MLNFCIGCQLSILFTLQNDILVKIYIIFFSPLSLQTFVFFSERKLLLQRLLFLRSKEGFIKLVARMRNCIQISPLTVMAENIIYTFFHCPYDSTYHLLAAFLLKLNSNGLTNIASFFPSKKLVNSATTDHYFEAKAIC